MIITQNLCEVCAPFEREIQQISSILGYTPKNPNINPSNLVKIFNSLITIGQEIGNLEMACNLVNELTKRIEIIKKKLKNFNFNNKIKKQKIICLE